MVLKCRHNLGQSYSVDSLPQIIRITGFKDSFVLYEGPHEIQETQMEK